MIEEKFWMVWNPSGRQPSFRHHSRESADTEAKRLAALNPGQQFFVLKAMTGWLAEATPVKPIKLERSEIPF